MNENIIILNDQNDIHKCGIYKLFHISKPEVIYIGSAGSLSGRKGKIGFARRFCGHILALRKNKHHSNYLQNIINKYGIGGLKMQIIEICDKGKLIEREQYYLDTLKPKLNTHTIADRPTGRKHSEATKRKWSIQRKGKKLSKERKQQISKALKGKTPKNLSILHSEENKLKAAKARKGLKKSASWLKKVSIPISQVKDGNIINRFSSMSQASEKTKINVSSIIECKNGNRLTAGGYKWQAMGKR